MIPPHSLSDEELIQLYIKTQQPTYFDQLYSRYYGSIYRKCRKVVKNSMDAQDFTHDIFIKVFHKLDRFEQRSSFSTWLYRVASNYCIDQLKQARRLQAVGLDEGLVEELAESQEAAIADDREYWVERGLAQVSRLEQDMLRLKYEQGASIEKIARQYNMTNSAVKMRLMRSRAKIQQFYVRQ